MIWENVGDHENESRFLYDPRYIYRDETYIM